MAVKTPGYNQFYRDSKKDVRAYNHHHRDFVESVTREDFFKIEKWMEYFGTGGRPNKLNAARAQIDISNMPEYLQWFLNLRFTDKFEFRKIYQMIRYRYNSVDEHNLDKNWNLETKWHKLAQGILRSTERCGVAPEWQNDMDAVKLYLKKLYKNQQGLCAISKIPMTYARKDENAISVDRIDSSLGYQRGNIHLTCWWVNRMKFDLPFEDFKNKIQLLAESLNNS